MGAIQPRWYQRQAIDSVWNYFYNGGQDGFIGNPLIELPTASGKSVVLAVLIQEIFAKFSNQRVIVVTHVKELVDQNSQKLLEVWGNAPLGIFSAGLGRKESRMPITYAGIDSIANQAEKFGHVDLVFVDEAHLCDDKEGSRYRKFFDKLKERNPYLKIIGLTATPWRAGLGHLTNGKIFDHTCYSLITPAAFQLLFDQGHLCRLFPIRTDTEIDVSKVKMRGGEYVEEDLQLAVDKSEITEAALDEVQTKAGHCKHWIVFATGVEHMRHIADSLLRRGISTVCVHSGMAKVERERAIADYKAGKYTALVNVGVLTTGFDAPFIDLIVMLRPTGSAVLWVQMLGRGMRVWFEKNYTLVMDFAGNTMRLGPVDDPVIPRRKGDPEAPGVAPVKECPQCHTINHASARVCAFCELPFPIQTKLQQEASNAPLIKGVQSTEAVVEDFRVDFVAYSLHKKIGKPDSIKVSYTCGMRNFVTYIFPEHDKVRSKSVAWWKTRSAGGPLPATTAEALQLISSLKVSTHLRVRTDLKFPDIEKEDLTGTCFGTNFGAKPHIVKVLATTFEETAPQATEFEDENYY